MKTTEKASGDQEPVEQDDDGGAVSVFLPALVGGCLIVGVGLGVRSGFGLFLEPITDEIGTGRSTFALGIAIQNLMWGLGQPVAGGLADRYGSGRVLSAGAVMYASGIIGMSQVQGPATLYLTAGLGIGLGMAFASLSVVLASVGRRVPESRRSWALGIVTAAASIGQFIVVPTTRWLIENQGWSRALSLMALPVLAIIVFSSTLRGRANGVPSAADQSLREAITEAIGHRSYLLLTLGFFVCGFHVTFIGVHLPSYVKDIGLSSSVAAWSLALIGLFNVFGAYSAGVLGGKREKSGLLAFLYLARAIVIAAFILLPVSAVTTLAFGALIGLLWLSTVPLTSGLVAQFFGLRYLGTLFGFVFFSHQLGSFLGVWLGGVLFDATESYTVVWWLNVALGLAAAALHWPIDDRPVARLQNEVSR